LVESRGGILETFLEKKKNKTKQKTKKSPNTNRAPKQLSFWSVVLTLEPHLQPEN
jgi:hypothetical protein